MDYQQDKKMGAIIANLRKNRSLTQDELASRLNVTMQAVSKWECDQAYPDITMLPRLADYFEVSIDYLFEREPNILLNQPRLPNTQSHLPWENDNDYHAVLYRGHTLLQKSDESKEFVLEVVGNIEGNLDSAGSVNCDTVEGNINANGSVTCDSVEGNINANGSVTCDSVDGNIQANGAITCDNVEGNVSANGPVTCDNVEGNVSGQNITCESIEGDVRAHGGTVICHGDINGDVEALTVINDKG